jgi:hypothetical protein
MRLYASRATLETILIPQEKLYRIDQLFQSENARREGLGGLVGIDYPDADTDNVVNFDRTACSKRT